MSPKTRKSISENSSELIADKRKLIDLVERAQGGDKKVLPTLRKDFDEEPKIARFVDLARDVERSIVKAMSGDDLFSQEAIDGNMLVVERILTHFSSEVGGRRKLASLADKHFVEHSPP